MGRKVKTKKLYNRPSQGMKRNLARQEMKTSGILKKRDVSADRFLKVLKVSAIVWIVLSVAAVWLYGFHAIVISFAVAVVFLLGAFFYIDSLDRDIIRQYKSFDITKEAFLSEIKRRGVNDKKRKRLEALWDKTHLKP